MNVPLVKDHVVEVFNLKTQKLKTEQHINFVVAAVTKIEFEFSYDEGSYER